MTFKILLLLLVAAPAFGQQSFEPQILVLSPNQSTFNKSMEKELTSKVDAYKKGLDLAAAEEFFRSEEFKRRPQNVQLMSKSEVSYLKTIDAVNLTSYLAEQHLSYALYEQIRTVVVKLKNEKSTGEVKDLDRIAGKEKATFVLNIKAIELYKEGKQSFAKLAVQLYDRASGSLLLDEAFTGGSENPGLEYTCEENSVDCCINNALSQALGAIIPLILDNNPATQKERQLAKERDAVLQTYLSKPFDPQSLKAILPASDKTVDAQDAYQVVFNDNQSQFVAFFTEAVPSTDAKAFRDGKNDKNVNIVSDDQMGFFGGSLPNTYAYLVKGVLYNGKWYYEKAEVTYFDADSPENGRQAFFSYLQKWSFFADNSATLNPEFWSYTGSRTLATTHLFLKIPDSANDPEDRAYAGMYEIVADQLQAAKTK